LCCNLRTSLDGNPAAIVKSATLCPRMATTS
jgi:hypothetical protein